MIVTVRQRLRHSLVQRCGRSVRQCSLACDTHDMHTSHCLLGEPQDPGGWSRETAKYKKASATTRSRSSSRYYHTNVETTDRAREERGILYTTDC
jgi:hypothetical protein